MIIEHLLTRYMRRYTARLTRAAGNYKGAPDCAAGRACGGNRGRAVSGNSTGGRDRAADRHHTTGLDSAAANLDSAAAALRPQNVPMLYLHVPFCKELCPFCTFYRIRFDEELAHSYFAALRRQLRRYHNLGYRFQTAYFGGGTPTVLPDELVLTINELKKLWNISEISVETNPSGLTKENIELLKNAGVNRLSVGVQSFQDNLLESVNRIRKYGTGNDICNRLAEIRGVFDTLNVDLIFGLEGQTVADVASDIDMIKRLEVDQVTCYPLMRSGGESGSYARRKTNLRWEKKAYRTIRDLLAPAYSPSSAWCFSKDKGMIDEYIVEYSSYAGAGSGAFGLKNGMLIVNMFSVERYIEAAQREADTSVFCHEFSKGEYLRYRLLMQMFAGVIDTADLIENQTPPERLLIKTLTGLLHLSGAVVRKAGHVVVTGRGAYYAVLLMKLFFEGVGELRGSCVAAHNADTILDSMHARS